MNGFGKSDSPVVPRSLRTSAAVCCVCGEGGGKRLTKGNLSSETSSGHRVGERSDHGEPKTALGGKRRKQPKEWLTYKTPNW